MFKLVAVLLAVLCALAMTLDGAEARHLSRFGGGRRGGSRGGSKGGFKGGFRRSKGGSKRGFKGVSPTLHITWIPVAVLQLTSLMKSPAYNALCVCFFLM
jgi:hypothetical protein